MAADCALDNIDDDDIESMSIKMARRILRRLKAQRLEDRSAEDMEKDEKAADEERTKLADLHEEQKGSAPKMPVEEDDLPEGMYGDDEDAESEDSSIVEAKGSKKGR